jgi:ABC-type Fe3+-hydroxamate transport system substrate-binding protein
MSGSITSAAGEARARENAAGDDAAIDALGRRLSPATGEPRIVCLVPSITELLFDLGLGGQVVGRTGFCIHPAPAVRAVAKVGGTKDVDLAAVRALAPTHVIVNIDENRREDHDALARMVPEVIVTHPIEVEDNLGLYAMLGAVFDRRAQATALMRALRAELDACHARAAGWTPRRVLYLIWKQPWMTVGPDTYVARMLARVGLVAVSPASARRYPEVDLDAPWRDGPLDAVLLSSEPYRFGERHVRELAALPALAGCAVRLIDGEMSSWYGSRAIAGLRYLRDWRDALDAELDAREPGGRP